MSITHVAIAAATVGTVPVAPIPSDVVTVNYRIESFNAPLTIESVSFDRDGSIVNVLVSLIQGTYAEVAVVNGSVLAGAFPPGTYSVNLNTRWRYGFDGAPYNQPILAATTQFVVSQPPVIPITVIEFYHPSLNHYFLTANPIEASYLSGNSATLGWVETGQRFNAYSLDDAVDGTREVCRFYGSVSPGPNSHFYTASSDECNQLLALASTTPSSQPRWNFEGSAFRIALPAGSACVSAQTKPIYRFYNNRALLNDSNHRYVLTQLLFDRMVSEGWIAEGVVMCSPI